MKEQIREYINTVFADAPAKEETEELKEQMISDVFDRYDDLIASGKTPAVAYSICVSGIGDISPVINALKGEAEDVNNTESEPTYHEEAKTDPDSFAHPAHTETPSQKRKATPRVKDKGLIGREIMNTVAVMLYIICWIPLVALSMIPGLEDIGPIIGLVALGVIVCVATGIMMLKGAFFPRPEGSSEDEDRDEEKEEKKPRSKAYLAIVNSMRAVIVALYFVISFVFSAWAYSWLIFIIGGAAEKIVAAVFSLKEGDE